MIVLIPCYKRTSVLHWVIQSVLQCYTNGIDERILILIVNNYYLSKDAIDLIVSDFCFEGLFQCEVIHREKQLPAIESWFSAIFSKAVENEVVMLIGDDDISLAWGLSSRYREITKHNADMLVSNYCQRLYFFDRGDYYWADFSTIPAPMEEKEAAPWLYEPSQHNQLTFLSNHTYRNTSSFRRGFEMAFDWCEAQSWVPFETAAANFPGFLPFAIYQSGGSVFCTDEVAVVRGAIAEEVIHQEYSDGGSTSFYCLLIYNNFNNAFLHPDLTLYIKSRDIYLRGFLSNVVGILINNTISKRLLWETFKRSKIPTHDLMRRELLLNFITILKLFPGLRGYRLQQAVRSGHLALTSEFIYNLVNN